MSSRRRPPSRSEIILGGRLNPRIRRISASVSPSMGKTPRSRRRVNKVMLHLTAEPDDVPAPLDKNQAAASRVRPSRTASAMRGDGDEKLLAKRVKTRDEYIGDDFAVEPTLSVSTDAESVVGSIAVLPVPAPELEFEQLCRAAHALGVLGGDVEDALTMRVSRPSDDSRLVFLTNPFGLGLDEVRADSLERVSEDDIPIAHRDVLSARPDATCVLTARSDEGELVALCAHGLMPLCQDAVRLLGLWRRADESNLGLRAARESARSTLVWFVRNRGLVSCGTCPSDALYAMVLAQRACTFQNRALAAVGGDVKRLDVPGESEAIRSRTELCARIPMRVAADAVYERCRRQMQTPEQREGQQKQQQQHRTRRRSSDGGH